MRFERIDDRSNRSWPAKLESLKMKRIQLYKDQIWNTYKYYDIKNNKWIWKYKIRFKRKLVL